MTIKPVLISLDLEALDHVSGGMQWQNFNPSDNVEDRRPQSDGGPVPDADWQAEQNGYNNSCYNSADGNEYSGDSNGGEPTNMGPSDGGGGDGGGGDGGGGDGGGGDGG